MPPPPSSRATCGGIPTLQEGFRGWERQRPLTGQGVAHTVTPGTQPSCIAAMGRSPRSPPSALGCHLPSLSQLLPNRLAPHPLLRAGLSAGHTLGGLWLIPVLGDPRGRVHQPQPFAAPGNQVSPASSGQPCRALCFSEPQSPHL